MSEKPLSTELKIPLKRRPDHQVILNINNALNWLDAYLEQFGADEKTRPGMECILEKTLELYKKLRDGKDV